MCLALTGYLAWPCLREDASEVEVNRKRGASRFVSFIRARGSDEGTLLAPAFLARDGERRSITRIGFGIRSLSSRSGPIGRLMGKGQGFPTERMRRGPGRRPCSPPHAHPSGARSSVLFSFHESTRWAAALAHWSAFPFASTVGCYTVHCMNYGRHL